MALTRWWEVGGPVRPTLRIYHTGRVMPLTARPRSRLRGIWSSHREARARQRLADPHFPARHDPWIELEPSGLEEHDHAGAEVERHELAAGVESEGRIVAADLDRPAPPL